MENHQDLDDLRVNITITGADVNAIKELRTMLEKRLIQRLSLSQVMRRLVKTALAEEQKLEV
jgi:hypothetical protein